MRNNWISREVGKFMKLRYIFGTNFENVFQRDCNGVKRQNT